MMDVNVLISNGIDVEESQPVRCTNSQNIVQDDEPSFVDNTKGKLKSLISLRYKHFKSHSLLYNRLFYSNIIIIALECDIHN